MKTTATLNATMKSLNFGIELETVGIGREALARAVAKAVRSEHPIEDCTVIDQRGRHWKVVRDGSLGGGDSGEIVSPILGYEDIGLLQEVVRSVREANGRASHKTGIHIHVGAERFEAAETIALAKIIHKQERLLEHALRIEPQRLEAYCKPIEAAFIERIEARRPRTFEDVQTAWYGRTDDTPTRYHMSRYHGLNLNSYFFRKTIEFRYFNGSVHAGEVKAYVQLALGIAAKALQAKSASSKRRAFDTATAKYDFRVFLLGIGLIGDEFKTARLHLTKHLEGSAAWKGERRD